MSDAVLEQPAVSENRGGTEVLRRGALLALLHHLSEVGYDFVTISPDSHRRVLARHQGRPGTSREDVLGWSRPFAGGTIDPVVEQLLADADVLEDVAGGLRRSGVRVSTVHQRLFLHSAYPTSAEDAVFLGPDTYRFAGLIARELEKVPVVEGGMIVDVGTGAGVGAIVAADLSPGASVFMTDINAWALELARINASAAGIDIAAAEGRNLGGIKGPVDLVMANPPYIIDSAGRAYRDGGDDHGGEISLEMTRAALCTLRPGGRFILYTGSAIVGGDDVLKAALAQVARENGCTMRYFEIDPDVFGEELETPAYRDVDRIAVVAAVMTRSPG